MKKMRLAFLGLGLRGRDHVKGCAKRDDVEIVGLCDPLQERIDITLEKLKEHARDGEVRFAVQDWQEFLDKKDEIDAVVITCSWEAHVPLAVAFMEAGIVTALEVGGAYCIEDCFRLVDTYEKTLTPFFFMENCCYGKREMMVLNMVRQGVFGTVVHCEGGYCHDLREEVAYGIERKHYRYRNYKHRNCDNYPTHQLGPICRVLDINHGNRMISLTSTASKAVGIAEYIAEEMPQVTDREFAQGDVVNTVIKCANGQTIHLCLNTALPRPYSRCFQVCGTKGFYLEDNDMIYLDHGTGKDRRHPPFVCKDMWGSAEQYEEQYLPEIWKNVDMESGHGGMDGLMLDDFITCLREGKPMPIDVYDAASWMCITCLSEAAITTGMPQYIPDFTRGKWLMR